MWTAMIAISPPVVTCSLEEAGHGDQTCYEEYLEILG